jgi:hypothetical protein
VLVNEQKRAVKNVAPRITALRFDADSFIGFALSRLYIVGPANI